MGFIMFSERWVGVGKFVGFTQTRQFLRFFRSSIVHNMTTRHRTRLTVKSNAPHSGGWMHF